ncbi:hypothetical protein P8605_26425 [Streptomyces sp. T-3]|nr:hypothetical protein [Streptomyces sp. T-3]
MSSFATHRRRVHDEGLSPRARHTNLRSCLEHFAPYGFRATYFHLCLNARIPGELDKDPGALVRAVEELRAARELWLADERAYAAKRRREKARGDRVLRRDETWRGWQRGWGSLAFCPDPAFHPSGELSVVVNQVLRSSVPPGEGVLTCRVCGDRDNVRTWFDGLYWVHQLCNNCGVSLAVQHTGTLSRA